MTVVVEKCSKLCFPKISLCRRKERDVKIFHSTNESLKMGVNERIRDCGSNNSASRASQWPVVTSGAELSWAGLSSVKLSQYSVTSNTTTVNLESVVAPWSRVGK